MSTVLSIAAACGAAHDGVDAEDGDDEADQGPPPEEALGVDVAALFQAVCARYDACAEQGALLSNAKGCKRFLAGYYGCKSGLTTAEVANAELCTQDLATLSCDALSGDWTGPCAAAFEALEKAIGYKLDGESCVAGECAPEYSCAGSGPCDMHCEWDSAGQLGDACVDYCAPQLSCSQEGRKCVAGAAIDAGCMRSEDCASSYCLDGICQRAAKTMPCGENDDCGYQLQCVAGKCEELARPGESCAGRQCTWDAYCVDGICKELPACGAATFGVRCRSSGECAPGLGCSSSFGVCEPRAQENEPCDAMRCAEGLECALLLSMGQICVPEESLECSQKPPPPALSSGTASHGHATGVMRAEHRWHVKEAGRQ